MHLIHHHFGFHPLDNTNSSKQPNIFQYFTTCSHFLQKMKAFYVVAAVVLAVVATAKAKSFSTQDVHPITWYNCVGEPDGNYVHPYECTKFISCSGHIASERDCAKCDVDAVRCPSGRLVYDPKVDACLWADQTTCSAAPSPSTPPTAAPTTSTTAAPTTSPTAAPTTSPTAAPTTSPFPSSTTLPTTAPTTASPPTTSTTASPTTSPTTPTPTKPVPGGPCDPKLCKNEGDCEGYLRCDKTTSTLVYELCGAGLLWNPLDPLGNAHIHGGICDKWINLLPVIKDKYRNDPDCLGCFWKEHGKCSQTYDYQAPGGTARNVQILSCSADMVFVEGKENCQRCQDVIDTDGITPCC